MKGLLIKDELRWHDQWSSQIGSRLEVRDSTNTLFVFPERYSREDILAAVGKVPEEIFQIFDLEEAPREECDFQSDSGICYRKLQ